MWKCSSLGSGVIWPNPWASRPSCLLNHSKARQLATDDAITRSAAGLRLAASAAGDHVVVAIGNAPTALEETLRLIRETNWRPACVIRIPVGFVGVEASKQRLIEECQLSGVPYITSLGRKGGRRSPRPC